MNALYVLLELDETRNELLEMTDSELSLRNDIRKNYVESLAGVEDGYFNLYHEQEYNDWVDNFENGLSNKLAFKAFATSQLTQKPCKKCSAEPNPEMIKQVQEYITGGMDFRSGHQTCQRQKNCETVLIDRNITVSGLRFWNPLTFTDIISAYTDFAVCTSEESKKMKSKTTSGMSDSINKLYYSEVVENIGWLKKCLPIVSEPLVSERDHYMALKISNLVDTFYLERKRSSSIVVVIGAAHVSGVVAHFENKQNMYKVSLEELETVPDLVEIQFWPAFLVILFIFSCCFDCCCIHRIRRCLKSEETIDENSDSESGADVEERHQMVDRQNDSVKGAESSESISSSIAGSTASVNANHIMNINDLPPPPPYSEK